jgi:DNA-binding transcriptional MerR regulator
MTDFEDGKDGGALRTIGEVSDGIGIKPHVLRYWEQQFSMLKPLKRSGGRRYYRPEDVALLERINRLVNEEGYTIKGAQAVLRSRGASEFDRRDNDRRQNDRRAETDESGLRIARPASEDAEKVKEAIERLKSIRNRLAAALEA